MSARLPSRLSIWPSIRATPSTSWARAGAGLLTSATRGPPLASASRDRAGLLAWAGALLRVDARGQVQRSGDAGRSWTGVGEVGGQPAAFASSDRELFVALHDGTVKQSTDGGLRLEPARVSRCDGSSSQVNPCRAATTSAQRH